MILILSAVVMHTTREIEATENHHHSAFRLVIILAATILLILFLRSSLYLRCIKFFFFDEWKNLPVIRSIIKKQKLHRLRKRARSIPFPEVLPRHIHAMDIERLAEYIVWLIRETDGIPKERTVEGTLTMLRNAEAGGYLQAVRNTLYYDWKKLPPQH